MSKENRQKALDHAFRFLDEAEFSAGRGDLVGEELLIQRGDRLVEGDWLGRGAHAYAAEVQRRTRDGRLRQGQEIGSVGHIFIWTDRVLLRGEEPEVYVVDGRLEASVETAGSITVTKHPTLTRMAAGAILPGSALIPGFAFQKKETHDFRELYFVIEHPDWAAMVQVNPDHAATVRSIALKLNQVARSVPTHEGGNESTTHGVGTPLENRTTVLMQLEKLGGLRSAGILSEEEFQTEKSKILGADSEAFAISGPGRSGASFEEISLTADSAAIGVALPAGLSFDSDDLSALAEARAGCELAMIAGASEVETAARITVLYNVLTLQRAAGDEANGSVGIRFRSEADRATFDEWLLTTQRAEAQLAKRCANALNALSNKDSRAAIAIAEAALVPVIGRVPRLHQRVAIEARARP